MVSLRHFACMSLLLAWHSALCQVSATDALGRVVSLPRPAERVVSLAPSLTESLFAIGAGDRVVGVTRYCNYPEAARTRAVVGGMVNPNIEAVLALRPDLIVVSMEGNARDDFDRLASLRIPVFVSNPRSLEDIRASLETLGTLVGVRDSAVRLTALLKAREDTVRARSGGSEVSTLMIVSLQPLMVVGRNTFLNELLQVAGARNIASRLPATYPAYSREALAAENPEVLVMTSDLAGTIDAMLQQFPEWKQLAAVRNGRVYRVDADLVSRPGPRAFDGLELLASLFSRGHQ